MHLFLKILSYLNLYIGICTACTNAVLKRKDNSYPSVILLLNTLKYSAVVAQIKLLQYLATKGLPLSTANSYKEGTVLC